MQWPEGDPVFQAPWQARLFALTVVLVERGVFDWPDWTAALAAERRIAPGSATGPISSGEGDDAYYRAWDRALTRLLEDRGLSSFESISETVVRWHAAAEATPHGEPITLDRAGQGPG